MIVRAYILKRAYIPQHRVARTLTPRPVIVQVFNVFLGAMLGGAPSPPVHF